MQKNYGIKKLYYDVDDSLEDVPLSFDCSNHYSDHMPPKPHPLFDKIKAAIKYFFSMKKK
jgi:hypothetical protein